MNAPQRSLLARELTPRERIERSAFAIGIFVVVLVLLHAASRGGASW